MFCVFFIIVTYLQLNIEQSYSTNSTIRRALLEPSEAALKTSSKFVDFRDINIEQTYWDWLRQMVYALYQDEYYPGYKIPKDKLNSIPTLNRVVSPVRLTQRRMVLIPNTDPFTSRYIKEGWASFGFDYLDSFDSDYEDSRPFGRGNVFNHTTIGSFYNKGGYVRKFDIKKTLSRDQALLAIDTLVR
jgi:hypothetical protein